jgi:serine phosphatase RsbU (regulator of sigma subunit)
MASVLNDIHVFRLAIQRSEAKRLLLLLGILGVLLVLMFARHYSGGKILQGRVFITSLCFFAGAVIYTVVFLWSVHQANRSGKLLPKWIWTAGVIIEASLPTVMLLGLVREAPLNPLRLISAPAILLYGIFIAANILHLSPKLSLLSGVATAGGHTGVILCAVHKVGGVEWSMVPFFASYPAVLLLTGVVAAFVSGELRHHVIASMEAADLKRRSELLQSELKIAREIQQSLFPKQELNIPGFEVIGWCKPATETGGDYYDWCKLPSEGGFAMLGDATGHGLGPALLIASCRAYVRADLPQNDDLEGFMSRLNERLAGDTDGTRFVTFVGALLDEHRGQVKLISAGHCPALLSRAAGGDVQQIKANGVPLGVMSEARYKGAESIQLERGDRLVVYTDGITEAKRVSGEFYGTERLIKSVSGHSKLEGQQFIEALYNDVTDFLGGVALTDDLTILSVRRL